MNELEDGVVTLIVQETGVRRERVQLASRLVQDIGMDGDDAVDFFKKFADQLRVDLTALEHHWNRHFSPEGGFPSLGFLVVIGVSLAVGELVHELVKWVPLWGSAIVIGALSFWISRFFGEHDEKVPVTVRDLVDSARVGKWIKQYDENAASLFRSLQ